MCLDHFVGLALKGLKKIAYKKFLENFIRRITIIILQANTQRAETLPMRCLILELAFKPSFLDHIQQYRFNFANFLGNFKF